MAGLIISRQEIIPYFIKEVGIHIYSIEELAYYVKEYIAIIEPSFFSEELSDYIRIQLDFPQLADRMNELQKRHGAIGDFIMLVAKMSGYFNETELLQLQHQVDLRKHAGELACMKEKGDKFHEIHQYVAAIKTYQACLELPSAKENLEYQSLVYYQLGCVYGRLLQFDKAEQAFLDAIKKRETKTYLKKLYFLYRLMGEPEKAQSLGNYSMVSHAMLIEWDGVYNSMEQGEITSNEIKSLEEIKHQYRMEQNT